MCSAEVCWQHNGGALQGTDQLLVVGVWLCINSRGAGEAVSMWAWQWTAGLHNRDAFINAFQCRFASDINNLNLFWFYSIASNRFNRFLYNIKLWFTSHSSRFKSFNPSRAAFHLRILSPLRLVVHAWSACIIQHSTATVDLPKRFQFIESDIIIRSVGTMRISPLAMMASPSSIV